MFFSRASCEVGPAIDAPKAAVAAEVLAVPEALAPPAVVLGAAAAVVVVDPKAGVLVEAAGAVVVAGVPPSVPPNSPDLGAAEVVVVLAGAADEAGVAAPKRVLAGFAGSEVAVLVAGLFKPENSKLVCEGAAAAVLVGVEEAPPARFPKSDGVPPKVAGVVELVAAGPPNSDGFTAVADSAGLAPAAAPAPKSDVAGTAVAAGVPLWVVSGFLVPNNDEVVLSAGFWPKRLEAWGVDWFVVPNKGVEVVPEEAGCEVVVVP